MSRATIHAVRPEDTRPPVAATAGVVLGGKYRLDEPIARGGMARVWRATHVTLGSPVAVKFIERVDTDRADTTERFLREARVAASVRHKNVVDIIDFGVVSAGGYDEPYMVMELLEGKALDHLLGERALSTGEAVELTLQILNGLDAVHRAGIVHRDMKPANVFVSEDQDGLFARLLDFGISLESDGPASAERVVVGTPEYMSPEQAFGDPLDARSDLYSVGVILYEMLSGLVPFEDPDPKKVIDLVATSSPPPLAQVRSDIPQLCGLVDRALARSPADRFEDARAMRRALLELTGGADATGSHALRRQTLDGWGASFTLDGSSDRAAKPTIDPLRDSGERPIVRPPDSVPAVVHVTPRPARRTAWIPYAVALALLAAGLLGWALWPSPERVAISPALSPAPAPTAPAVEPSSRLAGPPGPRNQAPRVEVSAPEPSQATAQATAVEPEASAPTQVSLQDRPRPTARPRSTRPEQAEPPGAEPPRAEPPRAARAEPPRASSPASPPPRRPRLGPTIITEFEE
ncbi:MAG: protein kinase [Sandaracinaceae bacterium]|nr:protein kinase [Sandaracinaceae bacterium]